MESTENEVGEVQWNEKQRKGTHSFIRYWLSVCNTPGTWTERRGPCHHETDISFQSGDQIHKQDCSRSIQISKYWRPHLWFLLMPGVSSSCLTKNKVGGTTSLHPWSRTLGRKGTFLINFCSWEVWDKTKGTACPSPSSIPWTQTHHTQPVSPFSINLYPVTWRRVWPVCSWR